MNNLERGVIYEKESFTYKEKEYFENSLLSKIGCMIDDIEIDAILHDCDCSIRPYLTDLATRILSIIDGGDGRNSGTGYYLIPDPECHLEDPNYELPENLSNYDIGGNLAMDLEKHL